MVKLHDNITIKSEPIENPIFSTPLTQLDLNEAIQDDFENEDIAAAVPDFTYDDFNKIKCEPSIDFTLELPVDDDLEDVNYSEDNSSVKKDDTMRANLDVIVKEKFKDIQIEIENSPSQISNKRLTRSINLKIAEQSSLNVSESVKPNRKPDKNDNKVKNKNSEDQTKNSKTIKKPLKSPKVAPKTEIIIPKLIKNSTKSMKTQQKITNFFNMGSSSDLKQEPTKSKNDKKFNQMDTKLKICNNNIKTTPNDKIERTEKESRHFKNSKEQLDVKSSPPTDELQKTSQSVVNYECGICNLIFRRQNSLYFHKRSHKPKIQCQICHKMIHRYNMTIHLKYHDDSKRKYKCDHCPKSFINRMAIQNHMYLHMKTKKFYCDVCGRGYNDNRHLREHKLSHTIPLAYRCDLCPKGYERKQALEAHMNGSHMVDSPWYTCNICDYKTKVVSVICSHRKRHNKSIPCDECGKKFASRHEMLDHKVAIHVNVKNVECKLCGKFFTSMRYMKKHIRRTHADPNKFKCELCPKTFKCNDGLNQHFVKHFAKKINCEICNRSIKSTNLKKHLATNMECIEIRKQNEKKQKSKKK